MYDRSLGQRKNTLTWENCEWSTRKLPGLICHEGYVTENHPVSMPWHRGLWRRKIWWLCDFSGLLAYLLSSSTISLWYQLPSPYSIQLLKYYKLNNLWQLTLHKSVSCGYWKEYRQLSEEYLIILMVFGKYQTVLIIYIVHSALLVLKL